MKPIGVAVEPDEFPWYDYRGFTFSLGIEVDGHIFNSGHSGSAFDPTKGKPDVSGGMAAQARIAYAKQAAVLAAADRSFADVTRVVENVTIAGLADYAEAELVRHEVFGEHKPVVVTVVVDRLVRAKALIEIDVHASPGGGSSVDEAPETRWRRARVRDGHDGAVYLPTILPVDPAGNIVAVGDLVGQYAYCLDRSAELLATAGLTPSQIVSTIDYTTPATRDAYARIGRVRRDRLGPVFPASAGILMSRLHEPGILVALDVIATKHQPVTVNPGWSRYETLTYSPGVRAGQTLYMSGFAALDMDTQQAVHDGDIRGQAEVTYTAIQQTMDAAGATQLLSTVEYVTPAALPVYREVADVRKQMLQQPYPVSTGIVCGGLLRPEFMLEVVPIALIPEGR